MNFFFYLSCLFVLIYTESVHAYPQMIRHQYLSCLACHTQGRGGGPLNEYGKGISQAFSLPAGEYQRSQGREAIKMGESWDLQAQFRGVYLRKFHPDDEKYFPMQADVHGRVLVQEKWSGELTLARTPYDPPKLNNRTSEDPWSKLVVRRALVSYDLSDEYRVRFGRDWAPFGLGIDDHSAYVRRENRQGVTDFPTELALENNGASGRWQFVALMPSFQESEANQEWGMGAMGEYGLFPTWALGGHFSYTESDAIKRSFVGVTSRAAYGPVVLLLQSDVSNRGSKASEKNFIQYTEFLKGSLWPVDWLELGLVGEFFGRHQEYRAEEVKYGPVIYTHLWRHFTLQLDAREIKREKNKEQWLMAQAYGHFW